MMIQSKQSGIFFPFARVEYVHGSFPKISVFFTHKIQQISISMKFQIANLTQNYTRKVY